jgi:hypothetical protein
MLHWLVNGLIKREWYCGCVTQIEFANYMTFVVKMNYMKQSVVVIFLYCAKILKTISLQ